MKNIIALILFAGGFAGWYLHQEKQEVAESLQASQNQVIELEKALTERRGEFQRYSTVAALQQKTASKQNELKVLHDKLKDLRAQTDAVIKEQGDQRHAFRQAQIGKSINLTLTSGRALGQVRIIKVDDASVSVANATGIVKVQISELPADLKQMFLF
jgi:uncharacterized protein HemX